VPNPALLGRVSIMQINLGNAGEEPAFTSYKTGMNMFAPAAQIELWHVELDFK
jgi:hypothetical protein